MTPAQRRKIKQLEDEGNEMKYCMLLVVLKLKQGQRWRENFTLLGQTYRIESNTDTREITIRAFEQ